MHEILRHLLDGGTMSEEQSREVFETIFQGEADPAQIGAMLALVQRRLPTVDELTGAARVMRKYVTEVPFAAPEGVRVLDTCGTGGAPKTFNVSTAVAFVVAAAAHERGVCVAKHGNRSRTGRGSSEVLEHLGVNVDASPEVQARCLEEIGVCFCYAVRHHPAMRHAAGVRKALGIPTMFNALGPLTNPARADRQLIGIYDPRMVERLAETLARLGARRAMVVHSDDGLDEIAVTAPTRIAQVRAGGIEMMRVEPEDFGVERVESLEPLRAHTLEESAEFIRRALRGEAGPTTDFVLVNAASALLVCDVVGDIAEGAALARETMESGEGLRRLEALVRLTA
ncbi:MAG: anthranilate phosphoribosyltransferase [Planctomycetota bacterium]|jgi:anthranilate phosphoribosyltransferase